MYCADVNQSVIAAIEKAKRERMIAISKAVAKAKKEGTIKVITSGKEVFIPSRSPEPAF